MKREVYTYPKSSFLSMEKDMGIIVNHIFKNDRLKKMLYYTTRDCLSHPDLTEDQTIELFEKNIKMVPKLSIDNSVLNYLVISFDNFVDNISNPEFRDNTIEFDIVCHFDQWQMKDFQLRPYKIAAEIDSMFNNQHLTGIGTLEFMGATQSVLTDEFGALCLLYRAVHGEEDRKHMLNAADEASFHKTFNALFNQ